MFFIEYTEHDQRKALNLATCRSFETDIWETGGKNTYALKIVTREHGRMEIQFNTKEELLEAFDQLMNALKAWQAHWYSQNPIQTLSH